MLENRRTGRKLDGVRRLAGLILILCATAAAPAAVRWEFVEVEVSLRPDGKATVVYKVALHPQGKNLHGFYFEGYTGEAHFNSRQCYAVVDGGKKHGLSIKRVGQRKFDIILANGASVSSGRVIYVFTYGTDLAASGHLSTTTSGARGKLVAFDWAPVQWDDRLGHYTLTVHWPIAVDAAAKREALAKLILTEKPMNARYLLDYFPSGAGGKHWLTQRVHWKNVPVKGHLRVQEDVRADAFKLPARRAGGGLGGKKYWLLGIGAGLIVVFLLIVGG